MTKKRNTQTIPFSMRLTFDERANLKARAGNKSLAIFIRSKLFDEIEIENRKEKVKGRTACAKLLGVLGQSEIATNLETLAQAAKSGSLPLSPDTQDLISEALDAVHDMKRMLMNELGVRSGTKE